MFQELSSITFPTLGVRATVSRRHRMVSVFDLVAFRPVGMLHRTMLRGHLDWQPTGQKPCPIEVFAVVATMI